MSLQLRISQFAGFDVEENLIAHGFVSLSEAIVFVCHSFAPYRLKLGGVESPYVVRVSETDLSISSSFYNPSDFTTLDTSGTPEMPAISHSFTFMFSNIGVCADYDYPQLLQVLETYARAWGEQYTHELGSVIDQLEAMQASSG